MMLTEDEREKLSEKIKKSQDSYFGCGDKRLRLSNDEHWKIWDMLYGDMIKKAGS